MKLRIYEGIDGLFSIRRVDNGKRIACDVSPELAAWIVTAAKELANADGIVIESVQFGPPLTEDTEIEI